MKDYRLSEIQVKCRERKKNRMSCNDCEFYPLCSWQGFGAINIEQRDMIELPRKKLIKSISGQELMWEVVFRNITLQGDIRMKYFATEAAADKFLAEFREVK